MLGWEHGKRNITPRNKTILGKGKVQDNLSRHGVRPWYSSHPNGLESSFFLNIHSLFRNRVVKNLPWKQVYCVISLCRTFVLVWYAQHAGQQYVIKQTGWFLYKPSIMDCENVFSRDPKRKHEMLDKYIKFLVKGNKKTSMIAVNWLIREA